jgi:hypothetical protein
MGDRIAKRVIAGGFIHASTLRAVAALDTALKPPRCLLAFNACASLGRKRES